MISGIPIRQVHFYAYFFITLMALVSLSACRNTFVRPPPLLLPTPLIKTSQPLTPAFQQRWLAGQPCVPPCWEGITPGKMFFPPILADLTAAHSWQGTELLPWQGFHDFRFYCEQIQPVADTQQRCPHIDK
jgi:hypothetical protein